MVLGSTRNPQVDGLPHDFDGNQGLGSEIHSFCQAKCSLFLCFFFLKIGYPQVQWFIINVHLKLATFEAMAGGKICAIPYWWLYPHYMFQLYITICIYVYTHITMIDPYYICIYSMYIYHQYIPITSPYLFLVNSQPAIVDSSPKALIHERIGAIKLFTPSTAPGLRPPSASGKGWGTLVRWC